MKKVFKKLTSLVLAMAMCLSMGVPAFAAQKNSETQKYISTISNSNFLKSGKTYGPWYGSNNESYSSKGIVQVGTTFIVATTAALSVLFGRKTAQACAAAFSAAIGSNTGMLPDDYVYGTVKKRYREVKINGEFAYFQTEFTVKAYMHKNGKNTYLGTTKQITEGSSPMALKN